MSENEQMAAKPTDLVVVGSSAGGIEALSILVSTLSDDFPAPIVLAQHLDPNRPSSLDIILQRRTRLPVKVVNTTSKLEPGNIYVVPSNRHVGIEDGHVSILRDHVQRPRPSVDLLLTSAATYGEHLIAVILTGSGSDGAVGAVEVKNAGGTVVVQDPQTARYPSMPLALPPTIVDAEADIVQIGPLLYDLLKGADIPEREERTENILHTILDLVNQQANINFHPYKTSTILRRIGRRMTVTHMAAMRDYLEYIKAHPEEIGELVKSFLINVTQFFRDVNAYVYLKNEILPRIIEHARARDHVLRFWTAGCSTGEEPYSLAMILTDLLENELAKWSIKVFATDVDEAAINFARRGIYSENLLKGVPMEYQERFFERVDHGYRIEKAPRQMVIFGEQDLGRSAPFPRMDMVMCRNVLIYFTPELQDYVLDQFAFSLGSGGYLFLGKAETVRPNQSYYELVNKNWKVYRCTGNPLPQVQRKKPPERRLSQLEGPGGNHKGMKSMHSEQESAPLSVDVGQLRRFNELLLRFLPIGLVVIDRGYHILTANGSARRLLGIRDMSGEQDFLHSVRGIPYSEVRTAIDTVFRERSTITLPEVELDTAGVNNNRFVFLSIALMHLDSDAPEVAAISVTDVTEQVQTRRQLEAAQIEQTQLMSELASANKRLNDVNKELLDSNEELQVANEELVLTHEELQATIEEFETTNEELQATNEELETNNEELQATNEELETTNDELRARTNELQDMSNVLESERVRLAEMVELAPFYIMVLRGPGLIVETFNPRYAELLGEHLLPGKPLAEVFEAWSETRQKVIDLAHAAYARDTVLSLPRTFPPFTTISDIHSWETFVHTVVPTHDTFGKITGVILYSIDESEQLTQEIEEESKRLKLIFENTHSVALALYDAPGGKLVAGSPRYLDILADIHTFDRNSLIGRAWDELSIAGTPETQEAIWKSVLATGQPQNLPEFHLRRASSEEEMIWDWAITPITTSEQENKASSIHFMLVSGVEITEQAHMREEVERLNQLKDDFISLASHELRTPLTSIMGNTEMIQRSLRRMQNDHSDAAARNDAIGKDLRSLESILHQSRRLNRQIHEMLDIAHIHSEQLELHRQEQVSLVALVRRVIETQEQVFQRHITLETNEEEVKGVWDEARIEQVLDNLLNNAIKYSPENTPVAVCIERSDREVIVSVHDEGQGIGKEQQERLFDRYYRVHSPGNNNIEGLGLGLYISHEIITLHGGRMWLESDAGEGSTFYFSLPLG